MRNLNQAIGENNRTDLVSSIINRLQGNHRTGMCECPTHFDETPSLHVTVGYKHPVVLKCFGGCSQEVLVGWAKCEGLWYTTEQEQAWERKQVEREAKYKTDQKDYQRFKKAYAILRAGYDKIIPPTAYLKGRGINIVPDTATLLSAKDLERFTGKRFPAMVVPVIKESRLVGAQVTLLTKDGTGKLATDKPKLSYGPIAGGYVPLADIDPKQQLLVGEGIENVLSAMQITGLPGIATLGAANMAHVEVPVCSEVIIVADNDDPGYEAAKALSRRLVNEGRKVRSCLPGV